jgi:hypothetical protein
VVGDTSHDADELDTTPKAARILPFASERASSTSSPYSPKDPLAGEHSTRLDMKIDMDLRMGNAIGMDTAVLSPRDLRLLVDETLDIESPGDITVLPTAGSVRAEDAVDAEESEEEEEEGAEDFYNEKSVALRDLLISVGEASMIGQCIPMNSVYGSLPCCSRGQCRTGQRLVHVVASSFDVNERHTTRLTCVANGMSGPFEQSPYRMCPLMSAVVDRYSTRVPCALR